jgi:REP element-mobilizing transposase RayT
MPEHVHLLLSQPEKDSLADALKSLKQGLSRGCFAMRSISGKRGTTIQYSKLSAVCGKAAL